MDACDVLIVGGGPAGSSCAWRLRHSGLDVAILDKQTFPRDKVCGGWITPAVLAELEIDSSVYSRSRVLQPITGFLTCRMGARPVETSYAQPVSYGIRRYEFDDFLLRRSGARLIGGAALASLERDQNGWIVNGQIRTPLVVGAGGHFCPVARWMGAKGGGESVVTAQEVEFPMDAHQQSCCSVRAEIPELYFCADMKGYGWCFRKGNILNVGLGRMDAHQLSRHVAAFLELLRATGRLAFDLPAALRGHAYLLYGRTDRTVVDDGLMLIGDAAGLAYAQSGEGIRPAVESGLIAAQVIAGAKGRYGRSTLEPYRTRLAERFGKSGTRWTTRLAGRLPSRWLDAAARCLLATPWFTREIVLKRWFLHSDQAALNA